MNGDSVLPPGLNFGVSISNGALLIGGAIAVGLGLLCHHVLTNGGKQESLQQQLTREMDINNIQEQIYHDVYAYAANSHQAGQNDDRIREVIRSMKTNLQQAITEYKSQVKIIHSQVALGQITQAQAKVKLAEIRAQFHSKIKSKWEDILHLTGLPKFNPHILFNMPSVP